MLALFIPWKGRANGLRYLRVGGRGLCSRAGLCLGVDKARKWRRSGEGAVRCDYRPAQAHERWAIPPVKCTLCWHAFCYYHSFLSFCLTQLSYQESYQDLNSSKFVNPCCSSQCIVLKSPPPVKNSWAMFSSPKRFDIQVNQSKGRGRYFLKYSTSCSLLNWSDHLSQASM